MNSTFNLRLLLGSGGLRAMAVPMLIIMILTMMILPVPPFLLDLLFTFNIALAIIGAQALQQPRAKCRRELRASARQLGQYRAKRHIGSGILGK